MKRKIYDELLAWKNTSKGDTALLIDGARRVGKSYIAENFAKENYKSYIFVDFNKVNADVCNLFVNYLLYGIALKRKNLWDRCFIVKRWIIFVNI